MALYFPAVICLPGGLQGASADEYKSRILDAVICVYAMHIWMHKMVQDDAGPLTFYMRGTDKFWFRRSAPNPPISARA
jgi:hypothetical protein